MVGDIPFLGVAVARPLSQGTAEFGAKHKTPHGKPCPGCACAGWCLGVSTCLSPLCCLVGM